MRTGSLVIISLFLAFSQSSDRETTADNNVWAILNDKSIEADENLGARLSGIYEKLRQIEMSVSNIRLLFIT